MFYCFCIVQLFWQRD